MAKGGARNRNGGGPDPKSARSDKLGVRFGKLPAAGYTGRVPAWPLEPKATARERALWKALWRSPQAAAWITEPWRWETVAVYVRWRTRMHDPDAPAAIGATVIRLADQIGLTPAGLRDNRWEIQEVPGSRAVAESEASTKKVPQAPPPVPLRDRLKLVDWHGAGT